MSSMISILSTEHGRLRREQRDIRKRDLYKALVHGRRERCWGSRWKIEYDGIIFIVNNSLTQEVTAYPSPLGLAPVESKELNLNFKTRDFLIKNPDRCTSHTVLVVDNSGSMSTHDIALHRDRQIAAYSITAMEFVAEQLFKQTATNSDVVTLIEFDRNAREVFSKEPFSWELYNKLLNRRSKRCYVSREGDRQLDRLNGDSNYLKALDTADIALSYIDHPRCAISLLFLSDGAPTDATTMKLTPWAAETLMTEKIAAIAKKYKERLNIQMIGFGDSFQDFTVLTNLAEAATGTKSGTKAEFTYCGKAADKIGSAVSSLVSSTTETRTYLLTSDSGKSLNKREVQMESEMNGTIKWKYHMIVGHYVYDRSIDDFVPHPGLPPGATEGTENEPSSSTKTKTEIGSPSSSRTTGLISRFATLFGTEKSSNESPSSIKHDKLPSQLAIGKNPYGKGAERLAFRCNLAYSSSEDDFAFNEMIAKETILVKRPTDNIKFHKSFCKAQDLSNYLAWEFNNRLRAMSSYSPTETPMIVFLPCSILVLDDPEWPGRGVLVEKKLNNEKYGWKKYNDNAGVRRTINEWIGFDYIMNHLT